MRYVEGDYQPCQWPRCRLEARHQIVNDHESIMVCSTHRPAVVINIETQGKIWIFQQNEEMVQKGSPVRPGEQKPRFKGSPAPARPDAAAAAVDPRQWAAERADAAATPMDPAADLVQPKRRTEGGRAASRVLGRLTGEE